MIEIYIHLLLASIFLICSGHFFNFGEEIENKISFYTQKIIFGIIFISFIALTLHFFIPLSPVNNSLVFLIILILSMCKKKIRNNIFNTQILLSALLVSLISFFLIYKSNAYQPDAGLYHFPYTGLINSEKINFGIANIHHRFGFVTIIQYTGAIFNNHLFLENGITIPLAIIASAIMLNFYSHIISYLKEKNISNIHFIYLFCIIIFISLKMSRYDDYGNDAPGHFLFFFLISEILKKKFFEVNFNKLLILSIFIFLNKISFILVLIFPVIWIFLYRKLNTNITAVIGIFFLLLWLLKNIIVSGCAIYPIKITCISGLKWTTINNQTIKTENAHIEIEAWSKGYPDQKEYNQQEFIKEFNWVKTWSKKHLIYILYKVLPFISVLIFIYIILRKNNNVVQQYSAAKLNYILLFSIISFLLWFTKAPVYRLGYSFIIIIMSIIYIKMMKKYFVYNFQNVKYLNIILFISILLLIGKQFPRIFKAKDGIVNKGWPNIYSNYEYKKVNLQNLTFYISPNCSYTKVWCTYYPDLEEKIQITNQYTYRMFFNIVEK
jgi:hypothetical protein